HHIAFINDIAYDAASGFATDEGAKNHNVPGNGTDYFAVIGDVVMNSAQNSICLAALDVPGPSQWDSVAGTHIFVYNNYVYKNDSAAGSCTGGGGIDIEGMM